MRCSVLRLLGGLCNVSALTGTLMAVVLGVGQSRQQFLSSGHGAFSRFPCLEWRLSLVRGKFEMVEGFQWQAVFRCSRRSTCPRPGRPSTTIFTWTCIHSQTFDTYGLLRVALSLRHGATNTPLHRPTLVLRVGAYVSSAAKIRRSERSTHPSEWRPGGHGTFRRFVSQAFDSHPTPS